MTTSILAAILFVSAAAQDRPMAKLTVALGTVETKPEGGEYKPLAVGGEIPANSWVKTAAKAKVLFEYADGTELRVNGSTEVQLESSRKLMLKDGELFLKIVKGAPFEMRVDRTRIETDGCVINVGHELGKKMTTLLMVDGKATVATRKDKQFLLTGSWCQTNDGHLNTPDPAGDPMIFSVWIHELLAAREKDKPDLDRRLQGMANKIGDMKPDPYEAAFRATPEAGLPHLAKLIRYTYEEQNAPSRRAAVRILADLAPAAMAEDFAVVLNDPDPETRVPAARGLKRLTGQDLGFDEKYWAGEKVDKGAAAWMDWVKKNGGNLKKQ